MAWKSSPSFEDCVSNVGRIVVLWNGVGEGEGSSSEHFLPILLTMVEYPDVFRVRNRISRLWVCAWCWQACLWVMRRRSARIQGTPQITLVARCPLATERMNQRQSLICREQSNLWRASARSVRNMDFMEWLPDDMSKLSWRSWTLFLTFFMCSRQCQDRGIHSRIGKLTWYVGEVKLKASKYRQHQPTIHGDLRCRYLPWTPPCIC